MLMDIALLLTEQGKNLRTLLESVPECIKLHRRDGVIEYINSAGARALDADCAAEVVGHSIYEMVAPEYHEAYQELIDRVFMGETRTLVFESLDHKACRRWVRTKAAPLRNDRGVIVSLLGITRDITERKRMEERLKDYEIQLRTIVDSVPGGVVLLTREGAIMDLNPAGQSILGTHQEVVGTSLYELIDTRDHPLYRELADGVFKGQKRRIELRVESEGEAAQWIEIHAAPLSNSRSQVVALLGIIHDISERQRAEERLMELQMALARAHRVNTIGELGCLLAHEINQPLGTISSYAEMCQDALVAHGNPNDDLREMLDRVVFHANRASHVIRRMREFVRRGPLEREAVALDYVLSEVYELIRPMLRKYSICWQCQLSPDMPLVDVDLIEVEQVLVNAARNAIDAMSQGESERVLRVRGRLIAAGMVEVCVEDNGPGIPNELKDRVLRPYFTSKGNGMGLGLSLSRSIVEMHGGKLWIGDAESGRGMALRFTLPAATRGRQEVR